MVYIIYTPIGYITTVKADGTYNIGSRASAKLWQTWSGAHRATQRIRKLHSNSLTKKALVIKEVEETVHFKLADYDHVGGGYEL